VQLASYTEAKELVQSLGVVPDGVPTHLAASLTSGFLATIASMPADIVKTRTQNQKWVNGKPIYTGPMDCLAKIVTKEGPFALWRGFGAYFARLGPHTVLTFLAMEQLFAAGGHATRFFPQN
jgi:solute carrier family 25 oxoglutarate transporter 11